MKTKHINKTTNDNNAVVELSDAELTEVSGGAGFIFLKLEGVEGESTSSHGGGGGGGKVNVENLSITKY